MFISLSMEHFFRGRSRFCVFRRFCLTQKHVLVVQRHDLDEKRQGGIPVCQQGGRFRAFGMGGMLFHKKNKGLLVCGDKECKYSCKAPEELEQTVEGAEEV